MSNIKERLVKLANESAALDISRTEAQYTVDACVARMEVLAWRISAIEVATTALAGLPSIDPEQEWLAYLATWRQTLCDELIAIKSPIRDAHVIGVRRNLELSILTIDRGVHILTGTGYDLTNLRLGQLMIEAGYEVIGADPDRNYSGTLPWLGSIKEVERRMQEVERRRVVAQAALDDALLADDERMQREAEATARRDALNKLPTRKVRDDGSMYDRYSDGRVVEV